MNTGQRPTPRTLRTRRTAAVVTAAALLPLALSACSGGGDSTSGDKGGKPGASHSTGEKKDTGTGTFGSACASVPKSGKGSLNGMAQDPVATAASHNPQLTTLVAAVKKAGLVDTLNSSKNITVFAPTDDAFKKVPKAQMDKVMKDKKMLSKLLTYHVVGKPLHKQQLRSGSYDTLAKQKLTTKGSGDSYEVNGSAAVGCGNVKTANATVHLVDHVLMPPKM